MNIPEVIQDLINAQDNYDSAAYANCFSETATVFDEGKTHNGRPEIQQWIAEANEKYKIVMKPLVYTQTGKTSALSAEISGPFDGSPIVLNYYFELKDSLVQSLRIAE